MRRSILWIYLLTIFITSSISSIIIPPQNLSYASLSPLISGENSLVIYLPEPHEVFGRSVYGYRYYVEIWGVVPEGVVEVLRTVVGSGSPVLRLTMKELGHVVSKWIEFYKINGKYWRPALLIQFSTYDPYNKSLVLAFGASITYDPEVLAKPIPRTEYHVLKLEKFPVIQRFETRLPEKSLSLSSCNISLQGLPGACEKPSSCNCCIGDGTFPYFARVALGEKLFDSSNTSIPEAFRDKIPLMILHIDPNTQTRSFLATYDIQSINKLIFRITILNRSNNMPIWGEASGEAIPPSQISSGVQVFRDLLPIGIIYWKGSFKLYTAYGYLCCYEKLCDGSVAIVCDPSGFSALVMIVTYVYPVPESYAYTREEAPLDISYLRSKLGFSQFYLSPGSSISVQRDPHELRINPVSILMAIILARLGVPWWTDALLSVAVENMPIAVEIVYSSGAQETLKLYNTGGGSATAYIATIQAIYINPLGSPELFKHLFVDIR